MYLVIKPIIFWAFGITDFSSRNYFDLCGGRLYILYTRRDLILLSEGYIYIGSYFALISKESFRIRRLVVCQGVGVKKST